MPTIIIIVVNAQRGFDASQYTTQSTTVKSTPSVRRMPRAGIVFAPNMEDQSTLDATSKVEGLYPSFELGGSSDSRGDTISLSEMGNKGYRDIE